VALVELANRTTNRKEESEILHLAGGYFKSSLMLNHDQLIPFLFEKANNFYQSQAYPPVFSICHAINSVKANTQALLLWAVVCFLSSSTNH
jgi:hypothetical protein